MVIINDEKSDDPLEWSYTIDKIKESKLFKIMEKNPRKTLAGIVAASLIGVTTLNDNVHFGSTVLVNPAENHYVYGIFPTTAILGNATGNNITFGLVSATNLVNGNFNGNITSYALLTVETKFFKSTKMNGTINQSTLFFSDFKLAKDSEFSGNLYSKGLLIEEGNGLSAFGASQIIGFKNYKLP